MDTESTVNFDDRTRASQRHKFHSILSLLTVSWGLNTSLILSSGCGKAFFISRNMVLRKMHITVAFVCLLQPSLLCHFKTYCIKKEFTGTGIKKKQVSLQQRWVLKIKRNVLSPSHDKRKIWRNLFLRKPRHFQSDEDCLLRPQSCSRPLPRIPFTIVAFHPCSYRVFQKSAGLLCSGR